MSHLHELSERLLAGVVYDPGQLSAKGIIGPEGTRRANCLSAAKLVLRNLPDTPENEADFLLVRGNGAQNHFLAARMSSGEHCPDRYYLRTASINKLQSPENRMGRVAPSLAKQLLTTTLPMKFVYDLDHSTYRQADGAVDILAVPRAISEAYLQQLATLGAQAETWSGVLTAARLLTPDASTLL